LRPPNPQQPAELREDWNDLHLKSRLQQPGSAVGKAEELRRSLGLFFLFLKPYFPLYPAKTSAGIFIIPYPELLS